MTTAAAGGRGANTATETRKANFNVLLDDAVSDEETVCVESEAVKKEEESLEQLLAAAVVSPTATAEDSMWATATSKHPHTKKRPAYQPRPVTSGTSASVASATGAPSTTPSTAAATQPHPTHHTQQQPRTREPVNLSEDTTLEFYEFPAAFRTPDLKAALERFQQGRYRLKWNNDTSCWFVFDGVEARDAALKVVLAYIEERDEESKFKVRVYKAEYYPATPATPEPTA